MMPLLFIASSQFVEIKSVLFQANVYYANIGFVFGLYNKFLRIFFFFTLNKFFSSIQNENVRSIQTSFAVRVAIVFGFFFIITAVNVCVQQMFSCFDTFDVCVSSSL